MVFSVDGGGLIVGGLLSFDILILFELLEVLWAARLSWKLVIASLVSLSMLCRSAEGCETIRPA
jgi:hypothetical protein